MRRVLRYAVSPAITRRDESRLSKVVVRDAASLLLRAPCIFFSFLKKQLCPLAGRSVVFPLYFFRFSLTTLV